MNTRSIFLIFLVHSLSSSCFSQTSSKKGIEAIQGRRFSNQSVVKASIDFKSDSVAFFYEGSGCFGPQFGLAYYKVMEDTIYLTSPNDEELKSYARMDSSHLVHKILKGRNKKGDDPYLSFSLREAKFQNSKWLILNDTTILMLPEGPVRHYYMDDPDAVMEDRKRDAEVSKKLWESGRIE
ncbi:hypothetical protein [Nafulsella turpanensis]|uniref:hypothetical protein n=1 Tax=Nafulsella turpanensis TaxID=1265690 RepID=UPI0003456294|nr:hypothetical protein [Nafulsella turpanensis]